MNNVNAQYPSNISDQKPASPAQSAEDTTESQNLESPCGLKPIIVPKLPKYIPGYAELDIETGLHVTGYYQIIDLNNYRLKVTGSVENPLEFSFEDLRCMPKISATEQLVCPGFFKDESTWSGVPLTHILNLAEIKEEAKSVRFISADGYLAGISVEEALKDENFLAYEMLGEPLPILHGFPLRAVLPSITGGKWVKWLVEINIQ